MFWSSGHPDQKVGHITGDLSVGRSQHPSSVFSTLSSVIYCNFLTWSPLLLLLLLPVLVLPLPPLHHFQSNLQLSSVRRFTAEPIHPELMAEPMPAITSLFTVIFDNAYGCRYTISILLLSESFIFTGWGLQITYFQTELVSPEFVK